MKVPAPADLVTLVRFPAALGLLWAEPLSPPFLALYALGGLSDLLDGPIARHTGTAGASGARLDSLADLVFLAAALARLLPAVLPRLPGWTAAACAAIAAVRLAAYAVGAVWFHRLTILHTVANKATGLALFAAPLALPFTDLRLLAAGLCALAAVSAMEELVCVATMEEYAPDTLSVFHR
ncbi:CDP-alcohol phosphatidyltransferase family protein [Dysosmobacter sp.]|uniref:CDP-alcohol phosphatidyltransferase family protein n=1 Tax=Dysosmobacter sp. TaxID=2591382 RepID=UPI002A8E7D1C|nr:CDP-alcohol phosphatidyltransferase family protein [Dysosmobacter sp.]MDY3281598.1 CDP-alcohol phosphatidyltransferase family protein [Dysosmobacter sp.]